MYAFSIAEKGTLPGQYVTLSGAFAPLRTPRGERSLGYLQSRLVFDIARLQLGASSPYDVEKRLLGEHFTPDMRTRWWEKICNDRLDLPRALARGDPQSLRWMRLLDRHTDVARRVLAMPLWALSKPGPVTIESVMAWRPAIEALGVRIPPFPDRSPESACRYIGRLYSPLEDRRRQWAGFSVALFCLRLAQAQGNLGCYALTYEAITSTRLNLYRVLFEEPLRALSIRLLPFYRDWFSTLRIHVTRREDLTELVRELCDYGFRSAEVICESLQDRDFHPFPIFRAQALPRAPALLVCPRHPELDKDLAETIAAHKKRLQTDVDRRQLANVQQAARTAPSV
ncbi:hypothetical protein [Burkholderia anthina]|uniref:hypothetical protein n=1 Tax=Burkholderia anthina TaxID=179879 RepID=UPI000B1994A2|nr:hypothetical protein [Burkholderia anthina]